MSGSTSGWSLARRVNRMVAVVLAVQMLIIAVMLASLLDVHRRIDQLTTVWTPSLLSANAALAAMTDQETGVRGYALGRDTAFLDPYTSALAAERDAEADLRRRLEGHAAALADLADFHAAVRTWQTTVAEPSIAIIRAGQTAADTAIGSVADKALFDAVRRTAATLVASIADARADATAARERSLRYLWFSVVAGAALILGSGLVVSRTLRRAVLTPIGGLVAQVRTVADGDLDHRITQAGPAEIVELARDVDQMRARLAAELARVESARVRLARHGEELARSNADLEQFAYVASHDLSEPLRKVTNFCQLLERQYADQLDDKARLYIGFMVDGAKRMQALITDLLAFSRVGRTTDGFRPVDLDLKLARALSNIEEQVRAAGARVDAGPLPTLPGDPTLLTALLQNLVGNAVKYASPDRPPHVRVTAHRDGDVWEFAVLDNGIGIEPQYAERIFAIFQRLHLRDQYGGTGIGLALARKIVDFHGGRIWLADPEPDPLDPDAGPVGSAFRFTLPETSPEPDPEPDPGPDPGPDSDPARAAAPVSGHDGSHGRPAAPDQRWRVR